MLNIISALANRQHRGREGAQLSPLDMRTDANETRAGRLKMYTFALEHQKIIAEGGIQFT